MHHVKVFFFATLRDRLGQRTQDVPLPVGTDVAGLRQYLSSAFPALAPLVQHALVAVNHEYAGDDAVIPTGAEVALFPPVSGG